MRTFCLGRSLVLAGWLVLLALPGWVQAADISAEIKQGEALFTQALKGDKRALRKAQRSFRAAEQKQPDHPLVTAYQGALLALQGRDSSRAVEKNRFVDQALAKLDEALTLLTDYQNDVVVKLETKLVVARTLINLPPFFNRLSQGRKVIEALVGDKFFSVMPESFRIAAYTTAARYAEAQGRSEDHERFLLLLVGTAPDSPEARQAKEVLKQVAGVY